MVVLSPCAGGMEGRIEIEGLTEEGREIQRGKEDQREEGEDEEEEASGEWDQERHHQSTDLIT